MSAPAQPTSVATLPLVLAAVAALADEGASIDTAAVQRRTGLDAAIVSHHWRRDSAAISHLLATQSAPQPALCQCGCGQPAPLATVTRRDRGRVAGEPLPYLPGHAGMRAVRSTPRRPRQTRPPAAPTGDPRIEGIIAAVEDLWVLRRGAVRSRRCNANYAAARHMAWWALQQACDLSPTAIARLFDVNHSSVVYGLDRVASRDDWQARLAPILARAQPGGERAALRYALAETLPAALVPAVYAYAAGPLLGLERHAPARAAAGLAAVARTPWVRHALDEALRRIEAEAHCARIDWHCRDLRERRGR